MARGRGSASSPSIRATVSHRRSDCPPRRSSTFCRPTVLTSRTSLRLTALPWPPSTSGQSGQRSPPGATAPRRTAKSDCSTRCSTSTHCPPMWPGFPTSRKRSPATAHSTRASRPPCGHRASSRARCSISRSMSAATTSSRRIQCRDGFWRRSTRGRSSRTKVAAVNSPTASWPRTTRSRPECSSTAPGIISLAAASWPPSTTSARWAISPRIPNCSTSSPRSSSRRPPSTLRARRHSRGHSSRSCGCLPRRGPSDSPCSLRIRPDVSTR